MAKKASTTTASRQKSPTRKSSNAGASETAGRRSGSGGSSAKKSGGRLNDPVDALIKLLQSPLVIDLLAVGATAALAAITEHRSGRAQAATKSSKVIKAAGKAAAAAVGRRLANEFEEIRTASRNSRTQASGSRRARAGEAG